MVHGSAASRASNPHPTPLPRSSQRSSVPAAAPRSRLPSMASPRPLPPQPRGRLHRRLSRPISRRGRCPRSPAAPRPFTPPSLSIPKSLALYGRWNRASPTPSRSFLLADGGLDPRSRSMEGEPPAPTWKVRPCIPISRALWKVSRRRLHGSWPVHPHLSMKAARSPNRRNDCSRTAASIRARALHGRRWQRRFFWLRTELQPSGSTDSLLRALWLRFSLKLSYNMQARHNNQNIFPRRSPIIYLRSANHSRRSARYAQQLVIPHG
jgi:hypothetical protein